MAGAEESLKIERATWCEEAARGLDQTLGDWTPAQVAELLEQEAVELWRINDGKTWMITRLEGSDLRCLCLQGTQAREVARFLARYAKTQGLASVSYDTHRPELARMLQREGFEVVQVIGRRTV